MNIRKAEREDLDQLLEIYNYEVLNGTATFDLKPKTLEEHLKWFDAHNIGNHPLWLAEVDGMTAGYVSLSAYREKEAYHSTVELSLYVSKDYRRQGVARELLKNILAYARQSDEIHTVVSVITGGNEGSIKLHESFGFVYCGTIKEVGIKFGRLLDVSNYQLIT